MATLRAYVSVRGGWRDMLSGITSAMPTPTPAASLFADQPRPTGANYVRYEDLYVSGDSLQMTLNRVTGNRVITFPKGRFVLPADFPSGYLEGVRIGHADWAPGCRGIVGSGRETVFVMESAPTRTRLTSGDNSYALINVQPKGTDPRISVEMRNFTIEGTALGANGDLDYNGLRLQNVVNSVVENVYVKGITGSMPIPPGESGAFVTLNCTGITYRRCEVDGRRNGTPVSATGWLMNKSQDITLEDCWGHHNRIAMSGIAWWWCWGTNKVIRTYATDTCLPNNKGYCFNHEQSTGVEYTDCVMWSDRNRTGSTMHMAVNWDSDSPVAPGAPAPDAVITVRNPRWDTTGLSDWPLVERWTLSPTTRQLQERATIMYDADGATLPHRWVGAPAGWVQP